MWGRIAAGAGVLALAALLLFLWGNARESGGRLKERAIWQEVVDGQKDEIHALELDNEKIRTKAALDYAGRIAAQEPVIVRSTNTVREFAASPAGSIRCLDAVRVLGIDADAAALGLSYPTATGGSGPAVRADAH